SYAAENDSADDPVSQAVLAMVGPVGVRAAAVAGPEFLGVSLNPAQEAAVSDADISGPGPVRVLVVAAREDARSPGRPARLAGRSPGGGRHVS
ncbi:MAG: hypothetical protein ACRDOK_27765, partial [Streptosporangiaceae bacterium]